MPIKSCQTDKDPGFKWGDAGKCYTYTPKNEGSKRNARKKATAQGIAIGDVKLEGLRVSFDYHETLTTDKGKSLLDKELKDNNLIYIISAAHDVEELLPFAEKYGMTWGGNFQSFKDYPHFEKTLGYNWRDLLAKYNAKDFIPNTQFVNI